MPFAWPASTGLKVGWQGAEGGVNENDNIIIQHGKKPLPSKQNEMLNTKIWYQKCHV